MVTRLCSLDQFKHSQIEPDALLSNDHAFIVIKHRGKIFVYKNSCPHLNKRLSSQRLTILDAGQDFIQCTRHNALFTLSQGECIKGPCYGQKLEKVAHIIRDNYIFIAKPSDSCVTA